MRHMLRNDHLLTVTVEYVPTWDTFLCEVHQSLDRVASHEFDTAGGCLAFASKFVDHHISSQIIWSLVDAKNAPLVKPKTAAYTEACRTKVEKLYGGRP